MYTVAPLHPHPCIRARRTFKVAGNSHCQPLASICTQAATGGSTFCQEASEVPKKSWVRQAYNSSPQEAEISRPKSKPSLGTNKILFLVQKTLVVSRTDCKTPSTKDLGETNRETLQGIQLYEQNQNSHHKPQLYKQRPLGQRNTK